MLLDVSPEPATGLSTPPDGAPAVLLVEDNAVNQRVFAALMRSIGYQTDVASSGFEALAALDRRSYAVVFMDCQMPVMDGYQTTEKIREREGSEHHTYVIALTASASAADRARCLDAGMDEYMTKPIRARHVAATLDHWGQGARPAPDRSPSEAAPT